MRRQLGIAVRSIGLLLTTLAALATPASAAGFPGGAPPTQTGPVPPSPVKPADAAPILGIWTVPLDTPRGEIVATLNIRVEAGKVVLGLSAPQLPEEKITDITRSDGTFTVKGSKDYHGPLSSYQGPVTMVLTLTPKDGDLTAFFDFNYSTIQLSGTATKKK
jgi:hypothetical protein